ncbi:hypothetical protein BDW62DRAFT_143293 [Aspergillus aurantiobrunneus]
METPTELYTHSAYGTRYSTATLESTESRQARPGHYELFLLIQDLLRSNTGIILEFPIDNWGRKHSIGVSLGAGGFSSVERRIAKGRWGNRSVMAYKRMRPRFDQDGRYDEGDALAQVVDELKLLSASGVRSHPNINQLKGIAFETQSHRTDGHLFPALMFDATSMGSLLDFIRDPVRMVDGPYWECCLDVARGLHALHSQRFIHGDVKCENVLIFPTTGGQGRNYIAKLTDFGCSMAVGAVGSTQYTRMRGSTLPYDAPEAAGEIQLDQLPFTDVYSFGLLVWRVAIDGADPFNDPRYQSPATSDGTTPYNYALIRDDKRNGTTLSLALNRIFDPDLSLSPDAANGFGEVLSIALSPEPAKRDLGRILEILDKQPIAFPKRLFGLSPLNAKLLREFTKFEVCRLRGHAQASYGLAEWDSIPPKASQFYHVTHKYGSVDGSFRGFGLSRLSPMPNALRGILVATENMYRTCGQPVPVIEHPPLIAPGDPVQDPRTVWDALMRTIFLTSKDASAMAVRSVGIRRFFSVMKPFKDALAHSGKVGASMNALLEHAPAPKKEAFGVLQGRFDFPGGIAAADVMEMLNEEALTKAMSQDSEPSRCLDFHLLTTCRLPFPLQAQLLSDVSSRAGQLIKAEERVEAAVEEAICYSMGFGVERDYTRYLSILQGCCQMGHRPAQQSLPRVHSALSITLTDDLQPDSRDETVETTGDTINAMDISQSQIDHPNSDGDFPLIRACRAGNLDVARILISKGADCSLRNRLGESAIHWVWQFDDSDIPSIVAQLTHSGADPNAVAKGSVSSTPNMLYPLISGTALHRAVVQGNKEAVLQLVLNGASVMATTGPVVFHQQHSWKLDPVQLACTWHDAEIVEILLDAAPFYQINPGPETELGLLYFAVQCQNTHLRMARYGSRHRTQLERTVQLLLRRGATNIVDKVGMTVLQLAVGSDMPEILECVTAVDAFMGDINTEVDGKTILDLAIAKGRPAAFDLLVRAGANIYQSSVAGHALDSAIKLAPGNDYFLKSTLELAMQSITLKDKNSGLEHAFLERQWAFADFLMDHGADINGLTHIQSMPYMEFTVFGSILQNAALGSRTAILDCLLSLAAKHHQKPQFVVMPALSSSALHLAAGQVSVLAKEEDARTYSIMLEIFPGRLHLEARDSRGWTPLHMAVSVRNVIAVRALLDAGADVNSMALVDGYPVGPSVKDMLFGQLFGRTPFHDFAPASRNRADRALEQLIRLFTQEPLSHLAKRSVTLRAEKRGVVPEAHRRMIDYVEAYSLRPHRPQRDSVTSLTDEFVESVAAREGSDFIERFDSSSLNKVQQTIQWNGVDSVRFLRNEGVNWMRDMGLLDAYLADR